jgi:hypothetical protein
MRIKMVNNKDHNFARGALTKFISHDDKKLAEYMKRLEESDAVKKGRAARALAAAMASCEDRCNPRQAQSPRQAAVDLTAGKALPRQRLIPAEETTGWAVCGQKRQLHLRAGAFLDRLMTGMAVETGGCVARIGGVDLD